MIRALAFAFAVVFAAAIIVGMFVLIPLAVIYSIRGG